MLRIAIDGTLFGSTGKGASRYFSSLFRHIADIDPTSEYHVFVDRKAPYSLLPQQRNFRYRPVHFHANLHWKLWQFPAILAGEHFDLVHFPSESRCFAAPCPSVVTVHEIALTKWRLERRVGPYHYLSHVLNEGIFRRSIGKAHAIIAVSLSTKNDLARLYPVDPEKITVIHEAPDPRLLDDSGRLSAEEVRARLGTKSGFVLSFATGDSRENVDVVLAAFSESRERVTQNLVLCGADPATQRHLRLRCRKLGIANRVSVLGFVDDAMLAGLYAAADLYVDISYYEGFGLQACEAMAFGVPVIASRIPAFMEVLDDAAEYVPVDDARSLSAIVERILGNRDEWLDRSRRSRERARAFSWRTAAERTVAIYRAVAEIAA